MIWEILIVLFLFISLLFLVFRNFSSKKQESLRGGRKEPEREGHTHPCPLCGKALKRGERVHSVIYSQGEDRLMNIHGCPWCCSCHPVESRIPLRPRKCPSCGRPLKEGNFAIARVFERPGGKIHVHVLGCPVCRERS